MGFVLEQPLYLLTIPVIFVVTWWGYRNSSEYLTIWTSGCLFCAGSCIAIAASAPTITLPRSTEHLIWLVDQSDSSTIKEERLRNLFKTANSQLDETDRVSVLLFGNDSEWLVRRQPSSSPNLLQEINALSDRVDGSESNPAAALNTALTAHQEGEHLVPILVSDGQFSNHQRERMLSIARGRNLSIHSLLSRTTTRPDVWIEQVRSPSYIQSGKPFQLQIRLRASASYEGQVRVFRPEEEQNVTSIPFSLRKNQSRTFRLQINSTDEAFQRYRIHLSVDGDEWSRRNNSFITGVRSSRKTSILWTGSRTLYEQLAPAVNTSNRSVTYATHPKRTEPYDLFLVTGSAQEASEEWQNQLAHSVRTRGSGLIMLGTKRTFALGGWANSVVEELLPTRVFPPDQLSLSVLLDVSGSMANSPEEGATDRSKIEIVRDAMSRSLRFLQSTDRLELRSFSNASRLLRPMRTLDHPHEVSDTLQTLSAGGETNLLPALRDSIGSLADTNPENRYLLIFTDGQLTGEPDEFRALSKKAEQKQIKFIILTTGGRADQRRLELLTGRGANGRVLSLDTIQSIESKLQEELKRMRTFIRTGSSKTSISSSAASSILPQERTRLPDTAGSYHRVTEKPAANTVIRSQTYAEPLLSGWQPGQGRSIVLTPLFDQPGSRAESNRTDWVNVLRQSIEWALPNRPSNWTLRTNISDQRLSIVAKRTTDPPKTGSFHAEGFLHGESNEKHSMNMTPLSPTSLRFHTERPESGSYQFSARINTDDNEDLQLSLPVNIPLEREYLHPRPARAFLETLSKRTEGQFLGTSFSATSLDATRRVPSEQRFPAERYAMILAGLFLLILPIRR